MNAQEAIALWRDDPGHAMFADGVQALVDEVERLEAELAGYDRYAARLLARLSVKQVSTPTSRRLAAEVAEAYGITEPECAMCGDKKTVGYVTYPIGESTLMPCPDCVPVAAPKEQT